MKLSPGSRLVIATHNPGKLREIAALLAGAQLTCIAAGDLGLPEPEETAPDFAGNAQIKAVAASMASGDPALADDSGFSTAALAGAPGVFSARWGGKHKDFTAAMARVNAELGTATDRRAWFTCALCLAWPEGRTATFQGRIDGIAVWPPRGNNGFGYDPIFQPAHDARTFGEMPAAEKDAVNHRARAFAQLLVYLREGNLP